MGRTGRPSSKACSTTTSVLFPRDRYYHVEVPLRCGLDPRSDCPVHSQGTPAIRKVSAEEHSVPVLVNRQLKKGARVLSVRDEIPGWKFTKQLNLRENSSGRNWRVFLCVIR
jgi:hypothetical protein